MKPAAERKGREKKERGLKTNYVVEKTNGIGYFIYEKEIWIQDKKINHSSGVNYKNISIFFKNGNKD